MFSISVPDGPFHQGVSWARRCAPAGTRIPQREWSPGYEERFWKPKIAPRRYSTAVATAQPETEPRRQAPTGRENEFLTARFSQLTAKRSRRILWNRESPETGPRRAKKETALFETLPRPELLVSMTEYMSQKLSVTLSNAI